ncbi:MAG: DUF4214 domain-containing protein [Pyrinomonadaceae bacterium]
MFRTMRTPAHRISPMLLTLLLSVSLAGCVLATIHLTTNSASSKSAVVVQALGRGKGLLNPRDERELKGEDNGDAAMSEALRSGSVRPLSLASEDFDGDGAPDLVTGYRSFGAGQLTLRRGNIEAFVPKDLKIYDRAAQGELPPSFVTAVQTFSLPEQPDLLLVGDFNDDGRQDLLTAARGGGLYLLTGDGHGGFDAPEQLGLPGSVTALTTGAFSHAEGWQAVIAGVAGPEGPALAIFNHDKNGLSRTAKLSALPAAASELVLGLFDDDPYSDLAVAAGREIIIVHGQKPAAPVSDGEPIDLESRMERVDPGFSTLGLATGTFVPDAVPRMDLAALSSDGTIHLLQRRSQKLPAALDSNQFAGLAPQQVRTEIRKRFIKQVKASALVPMWQPTSKQDWTDVRQLDAHIAAPSAEVAPALLLSSDVSGRGTNDLLLLDTANRQVHVLVDYSSNNGSQTANVTSTRVPVSFAVESAPVAVLPMPRKINGERDLVILSAGGTNPAAVPLAPTAVFTVTKTTDTNDGACNADCSLREAVLASNATAGSNTINVPAGTYNLSVTNPPPSATTGTGNFASQDLQVGSATNNNATIMGTGGTPRINLNTGVQDVITTGFDATGNTALPITMSLQNLEITGGTFTGIFTGADNGAGGLSNTTITNCNVHNNTNPDATFGQGGGHQNQCGTLSILSTTYATNTATNAVRGQGGAIYYALINPSGQCSTGNLTVTNSTFTSNTASVQTGFPAGGGLFISGTGATAIPISGTTFTSNNANGGGDGGAIASNTSTRTVNVTTSTFVTNQVSNAAGRGGAIDGNGGATLNVTFSRFIGNSATTATNGRTLARTGGTFVGNNNWWGQNTGPAANDIFGAVTSTPFLQLRNVISGANVHNGNQIAPVNLNTAIFTADILGLSSGGSTPASNLTGLATFPSVAGTIYSNGTPALGSIGNTTGQYVNGVANASTTFTSNGTKGIATVNAIADSQTAPTQLLIGFTPVFVNQSLGSDATPFAGGCPGAVTPCYATMGASITNVALTDLALVPGVINIQAGGYAESPNFNQGSTVNVTATVSNTGSFTFTNGTINANGNSISLTGDWTNNGSIFNQGTSTVTFNGGSAQNLNGSAATQTFNNLIVNKGGGTLTVGGSTTTLNINGALTLSAGTFAAGTAAAINVGGNWTNNVGASAFTPGTGTVTFNSSAATQSINGTSASQTFNNVTESKSGQILNTGGSTTQLDLTGSFNLSAGTFTAPATMNVGGDWTEAAGTTFTPGSGTVTFNGGVAQALNGTAATQVFNNFVVNKGGGTLTGGGSTTALTINGGVTLTAGTFKAGTLTGITLNNGDWANNGGTFTPDSSVVSFTNTGAGQNINGSATTQTFNGITVAKTAQTLAVGGSTTTLTLNGTMTLTSGTFDKGTAAAINVGGNWTNNGGTFTPGLGTVTFNSTTAAQSINGSALTQTFNNLTENKTGQTLSVAASTTTLNVNDLTITVGVFAAGTATNINVGGNWTNSGGTFSAGSGTVTFNGNGNSQTLSGSNTFNNLTINHTNANSVSASGSNLTVLGLLRVQSGTFTSSSTFANVQIDAGTTLAGTNGTTMNVSGNWTNNGGTFTPNGNTVNFNGSAAQVIGGTAASQTFNNFTVNKPLLALSAGGSTTSITVNDLTLTLGTFTAPATLDINGNTLLTAGTFTGGTSITAGGNWTNNGGTFTGGAGTVTFDGGAGQTIGGSTATTFNNLTNSDAGGIAMSNDNTVNAVLALTSSDITVAATKTLTQPVGGSSTGAFDVNGRVQRTGFVTGGAALSFGNPFNTIQVTAGTAPANIVVDLARSVPMGTMAYPTAVQRTYTITPSAAGFTATLRLHYKPAELNGNDPTALNLWRFDSGITAWRPNPATARDCAAGCTTNNSQFWVERSGVTTFSPWTMNSTNAPTASGGVITGRIVDQSGNPVEGAVVRLTGAQNRKFITDANGVYRFENVETNGFYTVTPARANYSFNPSTRSFSQLGETTEAAFGATLLTSGFVNPLDTPEYFVRQHYVDFLGREPDEAGFNFWSDQIIECGGDTNCTERRRENVSAAYFLSIEFRQTGGLVDALYRASYGARPQFAEFLPDTRTVGLGVVVGNPGWEATLQANKEAFVNSFVNRPAFRAAFDNLSNEAYVDTLISHTGISFSASEREALVSGLANGTLTRAEVLRSIAENSRFVSAKFNETFVMMEYLGYLRRDADAGGLAFWLNNLNEFCGSFERAEMVKAFIVSGEYRDRFLR